MVPLSGSMRKVLLKRPYQNVLTSFTATSKLCSSSLLHICCLKYPFTTATIWLLRDCIVVTDTFFPWSVLWSLSVDSSAHNLCYFGSPSFFIIEASPAPVDVLSHAFHDSTFPKCIRTSGSSKSPWIVPRRRLQPRKPVFGLEQNNCFPLRPSSSKPFGKYIAYRTLLHQLEYYKIQVMQRNTNIYRITANPLYSKWFPKPFLKTWTCQ